MDPPSPIIPSFVYEHHHQDVYEHHHQDQDPLLSPSSPFLCHPLMFNHGEGSFDSGNLYQHHQFHESAMYASDGRSVPSPNSLSSMEKEIDEHGFKLSILGGDHKDYDQGAEGSSAGNNWMSSSKIMNYDQKQSSSPFSTENVRVCSDCNTTKTPLWRSGPKGPKSLCNACGIRQRKARRAMAATTTAGTSTTTGVSSFKQKSSGKNHTPQSKKQCKLTPRRKKKLGFEDFVISLSNNSAFHRMFPQDETEAAILLMALSCGLVCD